MCRSLLELLELCFGLFRTGKLPEIQLRELLDDGFSVVR